MYMSVGVTCLYFTAGGSTMWAGSNTATYTGQMGNSNNFCEYLVPSVFEELNGLK